MDTKELFSQYGELMIRAEIIQNQIQEVKKQIAEALNQQQSANAQNQPAAE